jgi:hypothetical protein
VNIYNELQPQKSPNFLIYSVPSGKMKVEVFGQDETVWLTQKRIAELFAVDVRTMNEHLGNIFNSN